MSETCEGSPLLNSLMSTVMKKAVTLSGAPATTDVLAFGLRDTATELFCGSIPEAKVAFMRWIQTAGQELGRNLTYRIVLDADEISTIVFSDYRTIYMPSQKTVAQCSTDDAVVFAYTLCAIETALSSRRGDIMVFINDYGGSIVALEESEAK